MDLNVIWQVRMWGSIRFFVR